MLVSGAFSPLTSYAASTSPPGLQQQIVARSSMPLSNMTAVSVARAFVPSTHTITDAVAAAVGVYALDMLLPTVTGGGRVDLPVFGEVSGAMIQSVMAGAATLTASSIENAIGLGPDQYRLMGFVGAGDYVAKGIVPVAASQALHGTFAGVSHTLVDSLKVYSGTQLGIIAKGMVTGY